MPPEPLKTTTSLKKGKKSMKFSFWTNEKNVCVKKKLLLAFEDKDAMKFSVGY